MKTLTPFLISALAVLPASAAVIHVNLGNVAIPPEGDLYLDILGGTTTTTLDFEDFNQAPWLSFGLGGVVIANSDYVGVWTNQTTGYDGSTAGHFFQNVPLNSIVSASGISLTGGGTLAGSFVSGEAASEFHIGNASDQFESGEAGYLVFSYVTALGGPSSYGWLSFAPQSSGSGFVVDYVYSDTPGEAIIVGAIPEPSTAAALAGAAGLLVACARRRRTSI